MALERTLSIIKPDAVAKNVIGEIYARFEKAGLRIIAAKMKRPAADSSIVVSGISAKAWVLKARANAAPSTSWCLRKIIWNSLYPLVCCNAS